MFFIVEIMAFLFGCHRLGAFTILSSALFLHHTLTISTNHTYTHREDKALQLTYEACQVPFLDPTFNPDVEGVMMGIHGPTSSLIFLTQSCIQPQPHPSDADQPIPPRFEVGLQRRPIYQVAFRFLLFLHSMLRHPSRPSLLPPSPAIVSTSWNRC